MSRMCPGCGLAVPDSAQAYCGGCGRSLPGIGQAPAAIPAEAVPASTSKEAAPTGCGNLMTILSGIIALLVLILMVVKLLMGDPPAKEGPTGAEFQRQRVVPGRRDDGSSIEGFTTKVSAYRSGEKAMRLFEIRYEGTKKLEQVKLSFDFIVQLPRDSRRETYTFDEWMPGETKSVRSRLFTGRAVTFSWTGKAVVAGGAVRLSGGHARQDQE